MDSFIKVSAEEYRIPMKPSVNKTQYGYITFKCRRCKQRLREKTRGHNFQKFCPGCGQALDWAEIEERLKK